MNDNTLCLSMTKTDHNEIRLTIDLDEGFQTFGTCDRLTIYNEQHALMADYKTGVSQIDPPEQNYQAKAYVLGAFQKFPELQTITFVFYIPQYGDTPHHRFHREEMGPLRVELTSIIKEASRIRPMWNSGTPQIEDLSPTPNCRFCRHEDSCPALGGLVLGVAKKLNPSLPDVDYHNCEDPDAIEQLYVIAKIVSNWADTLRSRAVQMAKEGTTFPTLRLRSLGSTSSIRDNGALLERLAARGVDLQDLLEVITIPVGKTADLVASGASKGQKGKEKEIFLAELEELGIIQKSEPRYTLA